MKAMIKKIKNISFKEKIMAMCLFISLIPVCVLGVFSYGRLSTITLERERNSISESLRQEGTFLNTRFEAIENAMKIILWNDGLKNGLTQNYINNYYLYIFYKNTLDPLLTNTCRQNEDISMITIYTSANVYPHGSLVKKIDDAKKQPWFSESISPSNPAYYFSPDTKALYYISKMYYGFDGPDTYVCISIDYKNLTKNCSSIFNDDYGFFITDENNNCIYSFSNISNDRPLIGDDIPINIHKPFHKNNVIDNYTLNGPGWDIYLYRPMKTLTSALHSIAVILIMMIILCIALSFLFAALLTHITLKPLNDLTLTMKKSIDGDYSIHLSEERNDEIGLLIQAYNSFINKINHLINEVLKVELEKQKYELSMLQAQINPHFLYNSLSLINSKAIMAGQDDISRMSQLLSTFYRTTLNRGKPFTTLESELDNLTSYVNIQRIMHNNSFDVLYDIDDNLLPCQVPNLIMQPIAENAIIHGIDCLECKRKGILSISCYRDNDNLIIKITDNGIGMPDQETKNILNNPSRGYGIKNVNQRIQLYHGTNYGLSYISNEGAGTHCIINLPFVMNGRDEIKPLAV